MISHASISEGPLGPAPAPSLAPARGGGAVVLFEGVVRPQEDGRPIAALHYTVYQPMAERMLTALGEELGGRHALHRVLCWHSRGRVPPGGVSFRLIVEADHRAEALDGLNAFIDRLKLDVPIWKRPVWVERP